MFIHLMLIKVKAIEVKHVFALFRITILVKFKKKFT